MPCTRGCCASPAEHYRSLRVSTADKTSLIKKTVDRHDTHSVTVTQHFNDRQDVSVLLDKPVAAKAATNQES